MRQRDLQEPANGKTAERAEASRPPGAQEAAASRASAPLRINPPVEKLALWAFDLLVEEKKANPPQSDKGASKGKSKGKNGASPAKQVADLPAANDLAKLRKERLELLTNLA